jgi:hypothetical protein
MVVFVNVRRLVGVAMVSVSVCGVWCAVSAPAFANGVDGALGEAGSGVGQLSSPGGVAVAQSSGDVFVVDRGNNRVEVFAADGAYVSTFGEAGAGAGQLAEPQGIAIEQLTGDLYVTDQGNRRVDEFEGDGKFVRAFGWGVFNGAGEAQVCTSSCQQGSAGSGPGQFGEQIGYPALNPVSADVYIADPSNSRIERFTAAGAFVSAFGNAGAGPGQFAGGSPTQLAIDSEGNVYAVDAGNSRVQKLGPGGEGAVVFASAYLSGQPSPSAIALEPALDEVLAAKYPPGASEEQVLRLDTAGDFLGAAGRGSRLPGASGLAAGSGEQVYYASPACNCVLTLGPTELPSPTAEVKPVSAISAGEATLHGVVNPMESSPDALGVIYRLQIWGGEYNGEYNENREAIWNTVGEGRLPAGTSPVEVSAVASGLQLGHVYHVRVFAEREYSVRTEKLEQEEISKEETFTSGTEKPSIANESVSHTGSYGTTVSAEITAGGLETTYWVQYGTSSAYGSQTAVAALSSSTAVTVVLTGLQSGSEYHLRVVAENQLGTVDGPDVAFTTYPVGVSGVPDGRVYELVSQFGNPDTEAYIPEGITEETGLSISTSPFEASANGDALTFVGSASDIGGDGSEGNGGPVGNQYLGSRSATGGWTAQNISPPGHYLGSPYVGFSNSLSSGFIAASAVPPLLAATEEPSEASLKAGPLAAIDENAHQDVYARSLDQSLFVPLVPESPRRRYGALDRFVAVSADASHVLLDAYEPLSKGDSAPEMELESLFAKELITEDETIHLLEEESKLQVELNTIRVLDELHHEYENDPTGDPKYKLKQEEVEERRGHAEALERTIIEHQELYVESGGVFSLVNVLPDGVLAPGSSFGSDLSNVVSANGSLVFWTTGSEDPDPGVVFVRVDGSSTVQVSAGPAEFWTASADGKYAFYTEAGRLWRFDLENASRVELAGSEGGVQGVIGTNETGEDGAYVYFVASEKLTGEANPAGQQALAGEKNLYVFDAAAAKSEFIGTLSEGDGRDWEANLAGRTANLTPDGHGLVFQSTRNLTSGSYPGEGSAEVYAFDTGNDSLVCASCRPQASGGVLSPSNDPTHVHRWISEDGDQVFFESTAPLVASDVNGIRDVYEWERDGSGACDETDGCDYLLSNGISSREAFLFDASTSGDDVFIGTPQHLIPEAGSEANHNEGVYVYDARVDGVLPVAAPQCSGTGCQGAPAPAPIFATPSSETFAGVGNFPPPAAAPVRVVEVKRSLTRARKLARALRACRAERGKKRRLCEARARRAYKTPAAKPAAKKATSGKGR